MSDAHLGAESPELEKEKVENLFKFLDLVRRDGEKLYILGDLFDFWFEYKNAIPKQHLKVVFKLAALVESGLSVHYITGNHDFWLGDFLSREVGIEVHRDRIEVSEQDQKLFLIHGDGLAPGDWKYRAFVRFPLRNRLAIKLYRLIPPDWGLPLARKVSSRSRQHTSDRENSFLKDYEDFARSKLGEGYDAVLIGHTHQPVLKKFDQGLYINTGDFYNHYSYARMVDGQLTLEYLR